MRRRECGIVPLWIVAAGLSEYLRCNGNSGIHRVSNYAYHGIRTVPETQRKNKLVSGTEQMAAILKEGATNFAHASTRFFTIDAFVLKRSSRVIPKQQTDTKQSSNNSY